MTKSEQVMNTKSMERNRLLDIFKAIAIISIVVGHAPTAVIVTKFVYSYHIMAFFFAIGFAFKETHLESKRSVEGYLGRTLLKNVKFFFLYACIFCTLHNLFVYMGILQAERYSIGDVLKGILLSFAFYQTESYMGAFWFIPVMLLSTVIFAVMMFYIKRIRGYQGIISAAVFVLSAIFALILYQHNVRLTYFLQVSFLALPVMMAGYFCKAYWKKIERFVTWYGGIIAAGLILYILKTTGNMVELSVNEIISPVLFYPVTFLGMYFCLALAKVLERGMAANFFSYLGRNTFHVMALHFMSFKLLDFIYAKVFKLTDSIENLSNFPSSHYMPGIIYIIVGVFLPLAIMQLAGLIKRKVTHEDKDYCSIDRSFFSTWLKNSLICAFPVFSVAFFAPMEIFLGNQAFFEFSMQSAWWILFFFAIVVSATIGFAISVLPAKFQWIFSVGVFAGGICLYIQALFLNGRMASMDGTETSYSKAFLVGNIAVWCAVVIAIYLLSYFLSVKKQKINAQKVCVLVSAAIIFMQSVGLTSLLFSPRETRDYAKSSVLTKEGEFTLSSDKNLVVFILDTCDGSYIESSLEKYPGLFDNLNGFTYYPDCTTTHSRTYPSVPYLFTQEKCYFNKPHEQFVNEAYENSDFWKDLVSHCDDIRLYTTSGYIGAPAHDDIANIQQYDCKALASLNLDTLIKKSVKIGRYRSSPYLWKNRFVYSSSEVNTAVIKSYENEAYITNDELFCSEVMTKGLSIDDHYQSAFRFYHLFGPHPGNYLDENCQRVSKPTIEQTICGEFKMIDSYIAQMKELGIFDSATIIITTDHGNVLSGEHLARIKPATGLMMIKPAYAEDIPCKVSAAQVSHADWFATVVDALGGDGSQYGTPIYDIPEDLMRERYYYYTALYDDLDGEIALREYKISGNATDFDNWQLTGKNWNVDYSERAVSRHRLWEEWPEAQTVEAP